MRYEQLREQVLEGGNRRSTAVAVLLRQGLWAWMTLVAAQEAHDINRREATPTNRTPSPPPIPSSSPASARRELLAAWTDLVVGMVARKEATA